MINFNGKNILVVGASSGIGEETAYVLAENGASVILVARREEKLKEVCNKVVSNKKSYYYGDVSDIDSIEGLVKKIVSERGKLDGMAYVAGVTDSDIPLKFLTYERQMNTFKTNYFGFIEFVRQVTRRGIYNEGMRIAAVSSIASMDSAIRCIAKELGPKKICINSVAPAFVNSDMYQQFLEIQGEKSDAILRIIGRQYLGIAETRDVANALAFLLSDDARFITGITMPVDGGASTT